MAKKVPVRQTRWTQGEVAPEIISRFDVALYTGAAQKMRNVLAIPQGGFKRRPGLQYIAEQDGKIARVTPTSATAPGGGTAANGYDGTMSSAVVGTVGVSTTNPFVILRYDLGSAKTITRAAVMGLKLSGGTSTQVVLQWSADDVTYTTFGTMPSIGTSDVTRMFAGSQSARYWRLARVGATDLGVNTFEVDELRLFEAEAGLSESRLIDFQYSSVARFQILLTDECASIFLNDTLQTRVPIPHASADLAGINWTQSQDTLILFHKDHQPWKLLREGANATWGGYPVAFTNIPTYDYGSGAEAIFSATRGYPQCGTFHEGRFYMGGLLNLPATYIVSKAGELFNLDTSGSDPDRGYVATLDTDDVCQIYNFHSGRHLQLFTSSGEFYFLPEAEPITPDSVVNKRTSQHGSLGPGIRVMALDGATLFVQANGTTVRELLFTDLEQAYSANDIMVLSSHLLSTPVDTAVARARNPREGDLVFIVNSDGTLVVLQTLRAQQITAWMMWQTDGEFVAICAGTDATHVVVERTINGTARRFLEQFDSDYALDCAVRITAGMPTAAITGVSHLNGEACRVVADDIVLDNVTPSGGTATASQSAATYIEVGLDFPDLTGSGHGVWVKSMPTIPVIDGVPALDNTKKITKLAIRCQETRGFQASANGRPYREVTGRQFGSSLLDVAAPLMTEIKTLRGWLGEANLKDPCWEIVQSEPLPLTILAVESMVKI